MTRRQIFTPWVLDGLTALALFGTLFAVILIPHVVVDRRVNPVQAESISRRGAR
jgi:hypothetical protein